MRHLFEAEYAQFSRQATDLDRFRLTLELHENAVRMAQYPWEFLFIPPVDGGVDSEFFLAGERNRLILTRFVPKAPPRIEIKTDGPLRILIILSHPQELPPIASGATRDVIKVIQKLEEFQDVEVRLEENKTHTELCQLMGLDDQDDTDLEPNLRKRFKPDIVHFIGHGKPNQLALLRSKEEIQADEDEGLGLGTKDAAWCDSEEILALFGNHTPRLVFLHACESATPGSVKSFSNLARDLVYPRSRASWPCNTPLPIRTQHSLRGPFTKRSAREVESTKRCAWAEKRWAESKTNEKASATADLAHRWSIFRKRPSFLLSMSVG